MENKMEQRQHQATGHMRTRRAFTLIELLVVIAIIAILAAILFPVFGTVREQARQSSTMSSLHSIYVGAKLFNEDEGHFPPVLFGYAEVQDNTLSPPYRPALPADPAANITPMDRVTETFITNAGTVFSGLNHGYLYHEQIKDYIDFTNADNLIKNKQQTVDTVYWPLNSLVSLRLGGTAANPIPVRWTQSGTMVNGCPINGDRDLPSNLYINQNKRFYAMDSMDIGPMLNTDGTIVYVAGTDTPKYELHYSPDWSQFLGAACEPTDPNNGGKIDITQLKYRNPPSDRTVITYVTQHMVTAGSSKVIVLLLNGTARKVDAKDARTRLPLNYSP
jgi:prepilin-type N-terminal cleavage/methylation domain-containing protein